MLKRNSGFTLVEVIVTMSVMLILIAIGVPSFQDMMANGRTSTHTNNLATALNMARSEAVKRGQTIDVCSANAGTTNCAGAGIGWGNGWLVWWDGKNDAFGNCDADNDANDVLVPCEILRVWSTGSNAPTVTIAEDLISFGSRGELTSSNAAVTFAIVSPHCNGDNRRELTINPIGQILSNRAAC